MYKIEGKFIALQIHIKLGRSALNTSEKCQGVMINSKVSGV